MITQETLKSLLHYCPDTGIFTYLVRSAQCVQVGEMAGCLHKQNGYLHIKILGKNYKAHRLAWIYVYGEFPPSEIDHVNRIRADNRICNLRLAIRSENMQNKSKYQNNKSGYVGVHWNKTAKKWRAYISINRKRIHLGGFADMDEAIEARKSGEIKYHPFNKKEIA